MTCDAALTIQRAVVLPEKLAGLVTPEVAARLAVAVLADLGYQGAQTSTGMGWATARSYPYTVTIRGLSVTVTGGYDRAASNKLVAALEAAMKQAAGMLFSAVVQQTLAEMTGQQVSSEEVVAEEQGQTYQARLLTVNW